MVYRHLDSEKIINTLELLSRRINERFPQLGISKVVGELLKTGQEAKERCRWVAKPLWYFRILIWLLAGLIAASFIPLIAKLNLKNNPLTLVEFI